MDSVNLEKYNQNKKKNSSETKTVKFRPEPNLLRMGAWSRLTELKVYFNSMTWLVLKVFACWTEFWLYGVVEWIIEPVTVKKLVDYLEEILWNNKYLFETSILTNKIGQLNQRFEGI